MRITISLVAMLITLGGCKKELPPEVASALADDPASETAPKLAPVTKEEAEAFGKTIAKLLDTCVPSEIAPLWRVDITAARALKDSTIDPSVKAGVLSALTSERLWDGQCQSLLASGGGTNSLIGMREVDGTHRPIVRMLSSAGLNYAELELARFAEGIRAVDTTYYLTGEPLSTTLRRLIGSAQTAVDDGQINDSALLLQITAKQRAGDNAGALELIRQLPTAMRNDKAMMLMEVGLDPGGDDARYLAAIERFEKAYPGDPALDLVSIDGFFMRKQFDRLHATLDRLQKRIDDPYLEVMHALAFFEAKDLDKALAKVDVAITREPLLQAAWDAKSAICLSKKDFVCAVEVLKSLKEKFALEITEDIATQLDNGAELVASEPWKTWRAAGK